MANDSFNFTRWDLCRFYSFFWIWVTPTHYLIRDHLKYNGARQDAGTDTSLLIYCSLIIICLIASINIALIKPIISYEDRHVNDLKWDSIKNIIISSLRRISNIFAGLIIFLSGLTIETIISDFYLDHIAELFKNDTFFGIYMFLKYEGEDVLELVFINVGIAQVLIYFLALGGGRFELPRKPGGLIN